MAMQAHSPVEPEPKSSIDQILRHARLLSDQLQAARQRMYPPKAEKMLRAFASPEVSALSGIPESTLRTLSNEGKGPVPARLKNGHRAYTLSQINELRRYFAAQRPADADSFVPQRREGEHLQVLAVTNFKGGSAKTTTSIHFAQYLALRGYRVLAIDLDPQASMSSMFGHQPEFDVHENETIYAALRYDDQRRPIREVIRRTYYENLDLVPSNLEVMEFEHETPRALTGPDRSRDGIFFERLQLVLDEVDAEYDVVVLDTPPSLGYLTMAAMYAATGMVVTVHPAMLDVASMSQFLLMMGDLSRVIEDAGAEMDKDFIRYLVTRHDPNDQAQTQIVALLRHLFAQDVIMPTALQSTAVEAAGLGKCTIYETEPGQVQRSSLNRAREAMNTVNAAILREMHNAWGRT